MITFALTLAAVLSAADGGTLTGIGSPHRPVRDGGTAGAAAKTGGTQVVGALSKEEITKVLKRHGNEVRSCYEQSLRIKPDLGGKIAVKFIVGGTGDVLQAEIASDTLGDENFKACLLNVVRSWKFPEPKGGGNVTVTYPWVFKPGEPAK